MTCQAAGKATAGKENAVMANDTEIKINFQLQEKEFARANRLYLNSTKAGKVRNVVFKVLAIFLLINGIWVASQGWIWVGLLFIAFAPLLWFNLMPLYQLAVRKAFKQSLHLHELFEIVIRQEEIHAKSSVADSVNKWGFYQKLLEDEQLFLLQISPRLITIIPKRAFANEAEVNAFRELATRGIKESQTASAK